jgi:hypothetical protein
MSVIPNMSFLEAIAGVLTILYPFTGLFRALSPLSLLYLVGVHSREPQGP